MKKLHLFFLPAILICIAPAPASASEYKEGRVYRTRTSAPKQAIEQPEIIVNNFSKKKTDNNSTSVIRKKSKTLNADDKSKKKKSLRRRSKITSASRASSDAFHTRKNRARVKSKVNRFEDKNGDGINDIVKNPKL